MYKQSQGQPKTMERKKAGTKTYKNKKLQTKRKNGQKTMAEIFTERTRGQVNAATINDITSQINTRAEQMAQQWRRIKIEGGNYQLNRDKFETETDKMYQQLDLEKWKLNNERKMRIEVGLS